MNRSRMGCEMMMRGPFMEELGLGGKEFRMFAMEFPRMLEHMMRRTFMMDKRRPQHRPKPRRLSS
ncbi:MAG TPA: hypothetical protein VFI62_14045, partial [Burkholderiales bacterium]|nr:hypothetical protein [Burkholderiales bacterium]